MSALLASCTMLVQPEDNTAPAAGSSTDAVDFSVYVNRGVSSKAGWAGDLTTTTLQGEAGGFGVFGYYTNGVLYNAASKPDFMYNQQVTYSGSAWTYSPVKYWPNEFGASASSQASDRLTFFAYAPYAAVDPLTGLVTGDKESGIISMTRNIASGDPLVMYSASLKPGSGVDLCWGVAGADFTSSVDGNNNQVAKGKPFKDLIKPKVGDKIQFEFNHALAQLNVQVDADIDVESHAASTLADGTKIFVRSVTFTGFTTQGALNLNSEAGKPSWYDLTGTGRLSRDPVTISDGRTDGLEGVATAADWNEKPTGLNPAVVQDGTDKDGVTNTAVNLFDSATPGAPVMVIPTTGVPLKVTIVYDIETEDASLAGFLSDGATHGISVENSITQTVTLSDGSDYLTLSSGKKYVLRLHLGLTSVKFDAEVSPWDDTVDSSDVDLPVNTTALGTIAFKDGGESFTEATRWKSDTFTPTLSVQDEAGADISGFTVAWTSGNEDVATVDASSGAVALHQAGSATITATVTKGDQVATADYDLYVNEVTGISVSPTPTSVAIGKTAKLKATLTTTGYGNIAVYPEIAWVTGTPAVVELTGGSAVSDKVSTNGAKALAIGTSDVTASLDEKYMQEGKSNEAVARIKTINGYYRGYSVSEGLLKKEGGSYVLTNPDNPFVEYNAYIGKAASKGVYYHDWTVLRTDLGASGDDIKADSQNLPEGWNMPNKRMYETIIDSDPLEGITVNGRSVSKGFVHAVVEYEGADYKGVFLIPDGSVITCPALDETKVGIRQDGNSRLTFEDYETLAAAGCTFLLYPGYFVYNQFFAGGTSGNYWTSTLLPANQAYHLSVGINGNTAIGHASNSDVFQSVRLVKRMVPADQVIANVALNPSSATKWIGEVAEKPTVSVTDTNGDPLTPDSITWTSDQPDQVASVDNNGNITVKGAGVANITVTAKYDEIEKSATFELNVNEVTAVSLSAAKNEVNIGDELTVTATLTHTSNGSITSWPTVSWSSDAASIISVNAANSTASNDGNTTTATMSIAGVAAGSANITASVSAPFASGTVSVTDTKAFTSTVKVVTFGGYVVSPGILYEHDGVYGLTSGDDPFAERTTFGGRKITDGVTYYHSRPTVFPDGWTLPTSAQWTTILGDRYAHITYGNIKALLLIPDGVTLDITLNSQGSTSGRYENNDLSQESYEYLVGKGCLFIPCYGEFYNDRAFYLTDVVALWSTDKSLWVANGSLNTSSDNLGNKDYAPAHLIRIE